ncbi:hypothetical protein ARMSODRAFT_1026759 [Armillaria solidipes]|uniref:Uncharacterized protein n=1 Tax=Armillaria solidipes TaxID=1076256 RepID=A0A2H3AU31_9AGAR|nr:hypothetical protein ARMSODRAFT_1026759 [Armillaria solidipes]
MGSPLTFLVFGPGATIIIIAASQNCITVLCLRLSMRLSTQVSRLSTSPHCKVVPLPDYSSLKDTPPCTVAIFVYLFLPSYPETATWLCNDDLALRRMKQESSKYVGHDKITWDGAKSTLKNGRLYLQYLLSAAFYFLAVLPLAAPFIASVGLSAVADRCRAWSMCTLVSLVLAGTMFTVQGYPATAYSALCATLPRIYVYLHALCINGDLVYWQSKGHKWDNIGYSVEYDTFTGGTRHQ